MVNHGGKIFFTFKKFVMYVKKIKLDIIYKI